MIANVGLSIREASQKDRQQLANLIHFELYVHRHLDWRPPLEWLGYKPFIVAEEGGELVAALICPPDPPSIAWIRLFAVASGVPIVGVWDLLWSRAFNDILGMSGLSIAAAIPMLPWFIELLERSGFSESHRVVVLEWVQSELLQITPAIEVKIRSMNLDDIGLIHQVDAASFVPVWQNSRSTLELAFRQAAIATVVEYEGIIVGYQISTATPMGGHLARLAVLPEFQGSGIGYSLLRDLLIQFRRRGAQRVTVNTQADNRVSLALYEKAGFKRTSEEYPVYQLSLRV